ncbi:MAG: transposase, partial [Cyanobacteria bacterium WB6_1B_304]|nr:transposase [Cyanobacteria bacterium WB6_1B_304]
MLLTYQYRLQPTLLQGASLSHWGELLRRTRPHLNRCSLTSEPIG